MHIFQRDWQHTRIRLVTFCYNWYKRATFIKHDTPIVRHRSKIIVHSKTNYFVWTQGILNRTTSHNELLQSFVCIRVLDIFHAIWYFWTRNSAHVLLPDLVEFFTFLLPNMFSCYFQIIAHYLCRLSFLFHAHS